MVQRSDQHKTVNPNMIILGRESRGLSQKMLADELGVPQSRVSMIEMGLRPVPDDLLKRISQILDYPSHFFFQEGEITGVGITEVFHRKRQNVPKYVLAKIYAQIEIRLKHITALLRAADIQSNIPHLDVDEYNGHVEEIARIIRAHLQIPRGPIQDLTETLEDAGVLIIAFDFETPLVDAISRWVPSLPPLFFVNQNSPKDRYRYSLAHELGHVVMHQMPNPDIEIQANRFASELLLPEREVHPDLQDLNLAKLTILKRYWKVSMSALLMRAEDLGVITPNRARYLWTQMGKAGYKVREPIELDVRGEQPQLLHELVETHLNDLGYSKADMQEILALNEDELRTQYLQDPSQPPLRLMRRM